MSAPANAAMISVYDDTKEYLSRKNIITSATIIFAPEEIPSTNGPAIGFAKNVCNKNPDKDKAPPRIAAINTLGSLIFQIIFASVPSPPLLARIFRISGTEISTFPVLIFKTVTTQNAAASTTNTAKYLDLRLSISA